MKMRVIVDSSCDLSKEISERYDYNTTPLMVQFGEKTYRDRIEITTKELLEKYEHSKKEKKETLPKTSALNVNDLITIFTLELNHYDHIFFMPISSNISSIYNNAILAAREMKCEDKITILDSKSLSSGTGLLLIGILEDIKASLSLEEIKKRHENRVKKVYMRFVIDTMEFLHKGGRCSGMTYLIGSALKLHPIIKLEDGKMSVHKITRGKDVIKGIKSMFDDFMIDFENDNIDFSYPILIPNVEAEKSCKELAHLLKDKVGDKMVYPVSASAVIACHCGKNTCGLAYMKKN